MTDAAPSDTTGSRRSRRPRRTLRTRLVVGMVALLAGACAVIGVVTTVALRDFLMSRLDQQALDAGMRFGQGPTDQSSDNPPGGTGKQPIQSSTCGTGSSDIQGQSVGTFSAQINGGVVDEACVVTDTATGPQAQKVPLDGDDGPALLALPTDHKVRTVEISELGDYRLSAFRSSDGDIHIAGLPLGPVQSTIARMEVVEGAVFLLALLVLGGVGAAWVGVSLRPLRRVTATAAAVSRLPLGSGDVEIPHRVPDPDPDTEVGQLATAFNTMLGHVEDSMLRRAESEDRLRKFVADASHELRTPLAGIRSYAELARTAEGTGPDVRHALGRIESESRRMGGIVEDLLLLARLDEGRPLENRPVDLTRLVLQVSEDARVTGPDHRWLLDLPKHLVTVPGDEQRLRQVLLNLVTNARNHTPPGTSVTVGLAQPPRSTTVDLFVTDDGPGIPEALQSKVFERFARGDTSRSRASGTTGLGLAIVAAVVSAHHGTVSVESRPGRTTFRVTLPAEPVDDTPEEPEDADETDAGDAFIAGSETAPRTH